MKWTKIVYNPEILYNLQDTLPEPNKPIICFKENGSFYLKLSVMTLEGFQQNPSIDGTFNLNDIWWSYVDFSELPVDVIKNVEKLY